MTIKILVLKFGEDIITEVKEMVSSETNTLLGYFITKPYVVKLQYNDTFLDAEKEDEEFKRTSTEFSIKMYPWMPISKDITIPIPLDWVVTMVDPIEKVYNLYVNKVIKNHDNETERTSNKNSSIDQQLNINIEN